MRTCRLLTTAQPTLVRAARSGKAAAVRVAAVQVPSAAGCPQNSNTTSESHMLFSLQMHWRQSSRMFQLLFSSW